MQVNRASATSTRSASARSDGASAHASASIEGIAPVSGAENGLADGLPPPPFQDYLERDDEDAPPQLIDAIDPGRAYSAAMSLLRRQGMVGLLLNRTA
jgi:hypothetical protein